jgi:aminoglycoside phosphotransferase (APT) family kinase protein
VLPTVDTEEELRAAIADAALWPRVARVVSARHGVSLDGIVQPPSSFPVLVHRRHVLKLVPRRWRAKLDAERAMLAHLHGKLSAETPAIVAEGDLDAWGYVVMTRLEGRSARAAMKTTTDEERRAIVRAVGALIAEIHALDVPSGIDADWPGLLARARTTCASRHAAGGADPTWIAAIAARVADVEASGRAVPMHADVHADHVLLDERLRVTGLLDFGDAMAGDPVYDLVTPVTFFVRGRPDLFAALLEGYGASPTPELLARGRALQILHRYSDLRRDVEMLVPSRRCTTLDEALAALWPRDG